MKYLFPCLWFYAPVAMHKTTRTLTETEVRTSAAGPHATSFSVSTRVLRPGSAQVAVRATSWIT